MPLRQHSVDADTVVALVRDAVAAPSMHNAQPWRFRFDKRGNTFRIYADPERALPHADPANRALVLGCGAALFNLRVSAAEAGWATDVRLLPEPDSPDLLATLRLTAPEGADGELAALHPAIRNRRTSRQPFTDTLIPDSVRAALATAAEREGATLTFPAAWHVRTLLDLVRDAERRDTTAPGAREEAVQWTRTGPDAATAVDGIPEYAFGPRDREGRAPVRDFAGRQPVGHRESATFERTPQLALLATEGDERVDWLRAGQAMQRVLLEATCEHLATALTSHALEMRDLRWITRDPGSDAGHVQMVLRLGYGAAGPSTPRRDVGDVLGIID